MLEVGQRVRQRKFGAGTLWGLHSSKTSRPD
jgi:hypothetical protein